MAILKVKTKKGGEILTLDDSLLLGGGTEGVIYQLPGDHLLVIKIYRDKVEDERVNKLVAMVNHPPDDPMRHKGHASIAWPKDLVVQRDNDEVCGFLMPRLHDVHPISRFYDLGMRRAHLPSFTYQSLCRLASNLASAVWAIHEKGYVIGDINEGNIMATSDALVALVDTDSFQIKENGSGVVYRCTVQTPFYTPPEFQNVSLDQVDRSPEQDLFGIAVLFFQLLMESQLPFSCAFSGTNNPPDPVECLKRGYFPYAQKLKGISPPTWAPPYAMLHPTLRKLFELCFVDGHQNPGLRPNAQTWRRALLDSEQELVDCKANSQHCYFNHLKACPWCERTLILNSARKRGNWDPFPQPGSVSVSAGSSRRAQSGTQRPLSTPSPRPSATPPPPPSPVVFTASATSIAPGQSITFQWTVPNAHTVQLKEQSGRVVSTWNSPNGSATFWPTKSKTYQLAAAGVNAIMPSPITVLVTQPAPVALKEIAVELTAPIALQSAQLALLKTLPLKEAATRLISPMSLNEHMQLDGYQPLNDVTVESNYAAPVG